MLNFNELKEKLKEISAILKDYPEQLQPKVFNVLLQSLNINAIDYEKAAAEEEESNGIIDENTENNENENNADNNHNQNQKSKRKSSPSKESYQISKALDLSGINGKQSFSDFYNEKKPKSSKDFNVVAIYYLNKILDSENVTIEDVYTCYRNVSHRAPKAFKQSLLDTSNKYGYIEIKDGKYSVPISGINYVELDLPK